MNGKPVSFANYSAVSFRHVSILRKKHLIGILDKDVTSINYDGLSVNEIAIIGGKED